MDLRDAMRKAAGLLVELPPADYENMNDTDLDAMLAASADTKTVEQIVRDADGPNLDEITVSPSAPDAKSADGSTPATLEGEVSPPAIYQMAGLPSSPFSAEQMLDMLASLPSELPLDTKRKTVNVTLGALGKSLGATAETVVADASRKMAALTAYAEDLSKRTGEMATTCEGEIVALQAQIEEKRQAIQVARHKLATATQACEAESEKLDEVLEFFSLDVAPSKHAPDTKNAVLTGE